MGQLFLVEPSLLWMIEGVGGVGPSGGLCRPSEKMMRLPLGSGLGGPLRTPLLCTSFCPISLALRSRGPRWR